MSPILRILPTLAITLMMSARLSAGESLDALFAQPSAAAHPHTWWHWNNGNISKEGITLDLEAMHRIGVTGAQIFNVKQCNLTGPVVTGSPEWYALIKHAVQEADRIGMELAIHNCPGWSESGGPWITPEQSMQKVVWTETYVKGGTPFTGTLAQPETRKNYYRDIAVLAFPVPEEEASLSVVEKTFSVSRKDGVLSPIKLGADTPALLDFALANDKGLVQVEFAEPVKTSAVFVKATVEWLKTKTTVEASMDGKTFHPIGELVLSRASEFAAASFPETTGRFFRISVVSTTTKSGKLSISGIEFVAGPRNPDFDAKAGYRPDPNLKISDKPWPRSVCIDPGKLLDLTSKLSDDGRLDWQVPTGHWAVLRIGHTSTGQHNGPAPASATGLECDKLSRAAVEAHFAGMMGKIIADVGPLAGKSLKMVLADSWEAGCQNWTPAMREEFTKRRGYDPLPWLPAITGRVIGTVEESERFLWDFRRTIADLTAENHYGTFQELCHKNNMLFTAEAPGIGMPCVADQLQCKALTDVPMGEFWMDGTNDSREPASAAHIGGQQIATAEAFTARTPDAKWTKAPFDHKALGDLNFCRGINRFVFHRYTMQPWKDRAPGISMGPWGTNFERTNTWWEQAKPWMDYLSRSQALLQSGLFQADILYFYGEGAPVTLTNREPKIPTGYNYDAIDAGRLLKDLTVTEGRLTLPSGMSYRVLLLPPTDRLTPALLRKIKELAAAGATIFGARPFKSPSLTNYPQCDAEVAALAAELWGDADAPAGSHSIGKGRVVWGKPLTELLTEVGLKPDCDAGGPEANCVWIHRRSDDADIYFVSNQAATSQVVSCTFRISGKVPELWHPDTGKMELAPAFNESDGLTTVPLSFDPAGSVFVVFRKPSGQVDAVLSSEPKAGEAAANEAMPSVEWARNAKGALLVKATKAGDYRVQTRLGKTLHATVAGEPVRLELKDPWVLHFPPKWGAPEQVKLERLVSWTEHPDEGVRHFSGTAAYTQVFEWDRSKPDTRYYLDLGVVKEVAQVLLNGKDLGVLWKPPFRVEITEALEPGKNTLEVRVTNLWPNRLIGDAALPENQRLTWSTFQPYTPGDPLLPSGLLGPVKIQAQVLEELR